MMETLAGRLATTPAARNFDLLQEGMIVLQNKERATAKQVFAALGGMRLGEGAFLCHCPCSLHRRGDLNPSLSVKEGLNGRLLLHCFADGKYADVVAGLNARGLRL
jgi:hypothetical protein